MPPIFLRVVGDMQLLIIAPVNRAFNNPIQTIDIVFIVVGNDFPKVEQVGGGTVSRQVEGSAVISTVRISKVQGVVTFKRGFEVIKQLFSGGTDLVVLLLYVSNHLQADRPHFDATGNQLADAVGEIMVFQKLDDLNIAISCDRKFAVAQLVPTRQGVI